MSFPRVSVPSNTLVLAAAVVRTWGVVDGNVIVTPTTVGENKHNAKRVDTSDVRAHDCSPY
jgi:hypothetical protein